MIRQFELVEKVKSYDPDADEDLINRGYVYAMKKHGSQMRASGDPYFSHPLEVAYLLTSLKLDAASIVTALLHDTVEDTDATLEEIEKLFGKEIRCLVDGVTKLGKLETKSENTKQAENFRKLLLAMSEDIRVLMVKLADRLHNMRTLHHIKKEEKRARIAHETLEIYAVLAERIGMRQFKEELQDLSFAELRTEERNSIVNRLNFLREQGKAEVETTLEEIRNTIRESGIEQMDITGREKRPYSIWKKMAQKSLNFEQLSDIIAFRVIVDSVPECYQALGAVHAKWHMIPDEFDDYISTPKSNGYRSLHTAVIGPLQHRIEIQIRTREMHDFAENGVAAHWSYKQKEGDAVRTEGKQFRWMRELLEILERTTSPEDFLENTKLEMYQDQVFCFSPKGDLINLPKDATPVDFAYAVHSRIGDTCVGAKVNGRIVPLRTHLHNGDQVEIITSKTQTPSPAWERFVATGKARSAIRKFVRTQQRKEYTVLGKAIIQKMFKQEGADLSEKKLETELEHFNKKHLEDFYAEIGEGLISRQHVTDHFFPKKKSAADTIRNKFFRKKTPVSNLKREAVPIRGLIPGMAMHFAGCCHPIPGDRIGGVVTTGKGVTIHTEDCDKFIDIERNEPERVLDVSWDKGVEEGKESYIGRVKAIVSHETGGLATLANAIAKDLGNITNIKIVNRASDFFELIIDIEVHDLNHLNNIIANLRSQPIIQSIDRHG